MGEVLSSQNEEPQKKSGVHLYYRVARDRMYEYENSIRIRIRDGGDSLLARHTTDCSIIWHSKTPHKLLRGDEACMRVAVTNQPFIETADYYCCTVWCFFGSAWRGGLGSGESRGYRVRMTWDTPLAFAQQCCWLLDQFMVLRIYFFSWSDLCFHLVRFSVEPYDTPLPSQQKKKRVRP